MALQSLANNFDIRACESEADLHTFQSLCAAMIERKNFAAPPLDTPVGGQAAGLPANLRPRLVLAFQGGRPIVGAVVHLSGDTATLASGPAPPMRCH